MEGKNTTTKDEEEAILEEERLCGIGSFTPKILQKCATVQVFVGVYSVISLISQTLQAYIGSQIPSIEKQFGLKSSYSGVIMSFNDIGFLVACLVATPLARFVHIPRVLFGCFVLYGICGILCSVPHFISVATDKLPSLDISNDASISNSTSSLANKAASMPLCVLNGSDLNVDKCSGDQKEEKSVFATVDAVMRNTFLALFGIGMILQGIGKAPRGAFLAVYIDDGGDKKKTGFYMGIIIGLSIGGPALAYAVGGLFSKMYVTLEDVDITPRDPRWIGAWWLGFLVFGIAALVFSVPLIFFPRYLKKQPSLQTKEDEVQVSTKEKVKERVLSFWRVLKCPVFTCLLICRTAQMGSIAGYVPFLSKYIKSQYDIPLWRANVTLALASILSAALGSIVSGVISRKLGNSPRRTIGAMVILYIVYIALFCSGFFLGCDPTNLIGPDSEQALDTIKDDAISCSAGCGCRADDFFPICGTNGLTYHSPCYAGCTFTSQRGQVFTNCTCIPDGQATSGLCRSGCNTLYPFAVMCFLTAFFGALQIAPGYVVQIRSVEDRDKSTAIGLVTFCMSLLAWMPTPIIFGKVVDTACSIWQKTCSSEGACLFYDIVDFRIKLHVFALGYKLLSFFALLVAFWIVRNQTEWPQLIKLKRTQESEMVVMTAKEKDSTENGVTAKLVES